MEVTECACCRYIPVYALPAILVHRQKLIGPEAATIWAKLAVAAARSSLFLALYCTLAWRGMKSVHFISEIAAFRLRPECSAIFPVAGPPLYPRLARCDPRSCMCVCCDLGL